MYPEINRLLQCPACGSDRLSDPALSERDKGRIKDGVIWCLGSHTWYPIEDGLLELLTGDLVYKNDRASFIRKYASDLKKLGLDSSLSSTGTGDESLELRQQSHFDRWAHDGEQSYSDFESTPFWHAIDQLAFDPWRKEIQKGKWLLDVGCAQGRSTLKVMDLDIHIPGIDVSKYLVRQAIERYRHGNYQAKATFVAADANRLPVRDHAIDY